MKFMLTFVFIWVVISPAIGSDFGVDVCEYDDAILLFPNTPESSVANIRAKTWNKDNGIRLATWMLGGKFAPLLSYENRLMAIGENSIKILNATRSDTGTYTVVLTSGSTQVLIEYTSHLNVIVPPANQCIPSITRKGNTLVAVLPPDGCGLPSLTIKWMNTNQTVIDGNISVLSLEPEHISRTYTACAVGQAISCYQKRADKLCSNYTISALESQIPISPVSVEGIVSVIIIYVVIVAVLVFVYWKWESIKKKLFPGTEISETEYKLEEESHLMKEETATTDIADGGRTVTDDDLLEHNTPSVIDIREIKKHLIDQYKTMKLVSLSPCSEDNSVDVSQVYCDLEITHLGVQDDECRLKRQAENVASENEIFSSIDTANIRPIPALLLGECGSGKTTWCKNIVDQWCQYQQRKESSLEMTDSSIPNIARFEILLYIPSKKNLEGLSFMEHLRKILFANAPDYYDYTMRCIAEPREPVLVLIDGLDEVTRPESIVNLLKEKTIVPCLIVLTSRPNGVICLQKVGISLRLFQIQGISPDKSNEYASKVLDVFFHGRVESLNIDHFWKFAKHMQLQSMCNTPLLCLSLILFWINSQTVSDDLTDVILTIVEDYLRHAMARDSYRANISKDVGELHFDISKFIAKTRHIDYLTEHSYVLMIISVVAKSLWSMQGNTDEESIYTETATTSNENGMDICLETGILMTPIREVFRTERSQITFSHTLLFDFFVALSIAMGKRELYTQYITTKDDVIKNCYMIHMLCQIAPKTGQDLIKYISKIYDKGNDKGASASTEVLEQHVICKVKCKKVIGLGETPIKWLQRLMCTNKLSNEKLTILTDGIAFAKDLTNVRLELPENKNELILRLPILPKLQALRIDIENCTLLLHEERKWNKVKLLNLSEFVIKSVHVDVITTGYIIEAISSCKDLITLEFCPQEDSNEVVVAQGSLKPFYGWGCLAKAIKTMTKLKRFRLHNLQVGEHLPALLDILCKSPMMEIIDLMNLKEIGTGETLKLNGSFKGFSACIHHETTFTKSTHKTLQLTKNEMSEKSWLLLSEQLKSLSPHILHIDQVYQSNLVLKELLQGIGKCTDLNILSICNIRARNEFVSFSALRPLHKLTTLTLCKIDIPDSSWKELFYTLARLNNLKELSLARLEKPNCFIEVQQISKLKCITVTEIHLGEALWSKLGDEVRTLPKLKRLELVSCVMSQNGLLIFQQKMNESDFYMEKAKTSQTEDSELLSVDMTVTTTKKNKPKEAKITSNISNDEFKPNTVSIV